MKFSINSLNLKKHIFSYIAAFLITLALQGILGIVFSMFTPPYGVIGFVCKYMYCLSAFIAAFLCTYSAANHGLFRGIICADLYMAILLVFGMIFFGSSYSIQALIKIFGISSFFGAAGGITGINFKK